MTLQDFYARLEMHKGPDWLIPRFDDRDGAGVQSSILLFLESPGPQVRNTKKVSLYNDDPSARNLRKQLAEANVSLSQVLLWNIVPWISAEGFGFERPTAAQILEARPFNLLLLEVFRSLATIVFVGSKARKEFVFFSGHTSCRLLGAHHPSAQAMVATKRWAENVAVFERLNAEPT